MTTQDTPRQGPMAIIDIDYLKTINYALFHNGIPVCHSVAVTNRMKTDIEEARLTVEGDFFQRRESPVLERVSPEVPVRLPSFEIVPDPAKLAAVKERVSTSFTLTLSSQGRTILKETHPIVLTPFDHWTGTTMMPQSLVSFVTPDHPDITALVPKVAETLMRISGSSDLSSYLSGSVDSVRVQVAAAFAVLHQVGIAYIVAPPSFEETGQRVRLPAQVLSGKVGNCLELTLLMASLLEAMGLNAGIVLESSHAYLAVWLVDDCCPSIVGDDPSYIEKKLSKGISEMLVLESTELTQESASFESACVTAQTHLADHRRFQALIDVKRCRLERVLPLPMKIDAAGMATLDQDGLKRETCDTTISHHDRYDLSRISTAGKELSRFDIWERKLLDFSLRNSLLNLRLRSRAVQFISFDIDRLEDHLQDGEEYCIHPKPDLDFHLEDGEALVRSKQHLGMERLVRDDIAHHRLRTYQSETETKDTLKRIYRSARNSMEETGANSLFLSIGVLRWYETPRSEVPRFAPVLLLPVEIVYKKGSYFVRGRDEGLTMNITLVEFLRQNFDISIEGLDPLPRDASGVDVPLIFAAIRDAIKDRKRWDIEEESLLGIFSFSKFLMWNDIHSNRDKLLSNKVVRSLSESKLSWVPTPLATDLRAMDQSLSPSELALPVAVDSSQLAAVIEGGRGGSFILYGPPGTGKSQTITNLVANALYQGKRVLFVAEKMAALSVVQNRLAKIGLDPFCLELHSNKVTKRHVLKQLDKALRVVHIVPPPEHKATAEKVFQRRKSLISYLEALHDKDSKDGLSLFDCILRYESIQGDPLASFRPSPELDNILASEGVAGVEELLGSGFETVLRLIGQPSLHPLNGLHLDRVRLLDGSLAERMRKDTEELKRVRSGSAALRDASELRATILRDNSEAVLDEDPEALRGQWREAKSKWLVPRFFAKRALVARLKKYNKSVTEQEVDTLVELLRDYRSKHEAIAGAARLLEHWFAEAPVTDQLPSDQVLDASVEKLERWEAHSTQMRDWLHWSEFSDKLAAAGLSCVVEAMEAQTHEPASLRRSFLKAMLKHKAEEKMRSSELLLTFEGMLFDEKVAAYRRLSEEFQVLVQKELYARLASRVPRLTDGIDSSGEIGLLGRNISNGGRGLSLRDLFDQIPTLLPRLCPCFLMSPMSVAQYIDLSAEPFDLVIFDEASQMPTSESVGAIARGKALIVVGDTKQMPPTSFFTSSNVDVEEAAIDDLESILEDCKSLGMPSLQLSWHYRSRHESLIAFSNNEYYEGSLVTFPSVDDQSTKVSFVPVPGHYEKGGARHNRAEAQAIVDEVKRRLADPGLRRKSIGVISFSVAQQSLIEDLLQDALDKDKTLQEAADQMSEPIFVKNLENVQGDERDVILFSIGYGPAKDGKVSMNFGPLNNAGGERRLNVAVSRAREEMRVYSTLRSSDIDLRRSKAKGVEGLKHFLEYAETSYLPLSPGSQSARKDASLACLIAEELRRRGHSVKTNVGRSQFKVDVAVCDPSDERVYLLGILLDGEGYRDTQTTRDREIVQPSVLGGLRWEVMRVWSVDWYNNKERVLERIEERLASRLQAPVKDPVKEAPEPSFDIEGETVVEYESALVPYVHCKIGAAEAMSLPDAALMRRIIAVEQPVTFMHLCRRICALRESGRVTPTLKKALAGLLTLFHQDNQGAIWLSKSDCAGYSGFRAGSGREVADIPTVEIANALLEALSEQVAICEDGLLHATSRKFGFAKMGANVHSALSEVLSSLQACGKVEKVGESFRLSEPAWQPGRKV